MAGDSLAERIEAAEQRLQSLREHAQASPEQQPLLDAAAEDLALALDQLRAARDERHRQQQSLALLLAQFTDDRKLIEELVRSLEQERQILQTIMENTPTQLAYLDPEFNFVRVNAAYAEGAGHSREELIGRNHFALFPDPETQAIFEGVRDIGEPVAYQARPFEYADQPERGVTYWDWALVPLKDEAGMSQGLVISLAEVTEQVRARQERERLLAEAQEQRRQAQQASRETEAANRLLQALIETMPIGVVVADNDGTLVMTNAAAQAILGSPVAGDVSHPERTYTPHYPDGTPFPAQDMPLTHALTEGKEVHDVEILIRHSGGGERTILASAAPVKDDAGETVSAITVFQDITERKQAEEALQEERDRLAALVNSIRDEVWFADAAGQFTLVNPSASSEFALNGDATTDVRLLTASLQVLRPDGTPRPIEETPPLRALRGEEVTNQEESIRTPATGELRHRQVSAAPVRDGSGNIIGSVSVVRDITALKRVEEERERLLAENRRQRAFLERLIETAPVGLAVVRGPDHRYEMVNPAYQAIPGMPDTPMVGRTIAQVFPDVAARGALEMVERAYETGQTVGAREYEASVGPGREETYWDVDQVPLREPDGTVDSLLIVADEVTDKVLARRQVQELADSLARERDVLQTIMENTRAQLAYLDPQLRFVLVNSAYVQGSGHSGEELIGHHHFDLFPDPENQAIFERVRDTGEPVEFLARPFEFADQPERGVTYWDWTLAPVKDQEGQVQGLVLSLMDVTEQERARRDLDQYADRLRILHAQEQRHAEELEAQVARRTAALQASQMRLRTIFDGAAMGIALADLEGRILESNPALQAMLGYCADELDGMMFTDLAHPEELAANREQFQDLVAGTSQEVRLDQRCIRKDGQTVWARLMISLVHSGQDPAYAIGLVEDITERKQMQDALLNAEKLAIAGQLGASLAHEINNPLQSVIGCLGLAERNLTEGDGVHRYLRVAREELRRAAGIVAQLRDLHRLSETEEEKATNLNELLEQVLLLCKKKCEECRIEPSWNAADDLPSILLVPDRMRQVFLNLILNALDATPEGGRLEVSTARTAASSETPAGVCISFADSGAGIAPDVLPHIFDPFYSTKPQGLGLGLYITHKIVEAHGGRIDVSSRPGEGTIFSVWLPA